MSTYSNSSGNLAVAFSQLRTILTDIFNTTGTTITDFPNTPSWTYLYALIDTARNLLFYTEAQIMTYGVARLYDNLNTLSSLPLTLSTQDRQYLSYRYAAVNATKVALGSLCSVSVSSASNLTSGTAIVSDPAYYEYLAQYEEETAPDAVSSLGIVGAAEDNAAAWGRIAEALQSSGLDYPNNLLDLLTYMQQTTQAQAEFTSAYLSLSTGLTDKQLWNYAIVLPVITSMSSYYWNRVTSNNLQLLMLTKYGLQKMLLYSQQALANYRKIVQPAPQTAILHQNETLMDFSSRVLGDYTQWATIASINNLKPPYTADTASANVASPGTRLTLPGSQSSAQQTSYLYNVLGVDTNFGDPTGDLPQWGGDFQVTVGYDNLKSALIRRLLTSYGEYIYHTDFGSRLNGLLGEPLSSTNAQMIKTYAKAALLSDPRVQDVLNLTVSATELGLVSIQASIQPIGSNVSATNLDVVLQPKP